MSSQLDTPLGRDYKARDRAATHTYESRRADLVALLVDLRGGTMVIPTSAQRINILVLAALLLAGTARAQEAAIAGVVKDPSGAVMPGVTVTAESPVVDVVNVRKQTVVSKDQLEALPTSTKSVGTLATITTGLTGLGDVGGSYQVEPGQDVVSGGGRFHGKSGTKVSYDGMGMENSSGNSSYQLNSASVEELVMSTSGISADTNADGLVVNVIPKEGSNTFRTELSGLFSNHSLESNNLDDNLRSRGLTSANRTIKLFDESASVGGPIKRDTLWFFVAPRSWGLARGQAGVYWNKTQNVFLTPSTADRKVVLWTPWIDRPIDRRSRHNFPVERALPARRDQRHHGRERQRTRHQLRRADDVPGAPGRPRSLHTARIIVVRDWFAQFQDRVPNRGAQHERLHARQWRPHVHVPQRDADLDHAACDTLPADRTGQSGSGRLCPGPVEGLEQADAQRRNPVGLLQRLRAGTEGGVRRGHRRLLCRSINREPMAGATHVRFSQRRAHLEGLGPAARHRLRPVRKRQDGMQGVARSIRRQTGDGDPGIGEPDLHIGHVSHARVDRQRQLRSRLQPRRFRRQRRMSGNQQPELRKE